MVRYVRDEELIADALKQTRRSVRDVQRPTGTERAQTMLTAIDALDKADDAVQGVRVPAPVVGVFEVSNVGEWSSVGPVAKITIGWSAVTLGADGDPITVTEYQVFVGEAQSVSTPMLEGVVQVPSGLTVDVRVRAVTAAGVFGDLSDPLTVTGAKPGTVARAPSLPELKTGFGVVAARWDGLYESGGTSGAHTVMVESRIGAADWTVQGAPLTGAGGATFEGTAGDIVEVRLRAYDQLGRLTGTSDTATITVVAIGGDDLDAEDIWANEAWLNRLRAGVIEVDMVVPGFGDTINLNGNVSIQPIRDRQEAQDGQIQEAQEAADAAQTSADQAAADAATNQAAITTLAQGRILTAEQALSVLSGKIDAYDNAFSFESDGLHIRESRAALAEMLLASAGARLIANGVVVSEWNQGQLIVPNIVAAGGQLGHHIIDSTIPGHTVFRAVS